MGVGYVVLIVSIQNCWWRRKEFITQKSQEKASVTVIIAARNEENFIKLCVLSILSNDFPADKFEIIVIDDGSKDDTVKNIQSLKSEQLSVWPLPEDMTGKKAAIEYGITKARFPIILCTDADCIVGKHWIGAHASFHATFSDVLVTGIVLPEDQSSILSRFQFFDFAATMLMTHFGINNKIFFLANGANISYRKETFEKLGGYKGNEHVASGDDLFLIHKKAHDAPDTIHFITSLDGAVNTKSEESWSDLVRQRIRWASKSMKTGDNYLKIVQGSICLYSIFTLFCLIHCLVFISWFSLTPLLIVVSVKLITDFFFLKSLSWIFIRKKAMNDFLPCFLIYYLHIVGSGLIAIMPKAYLWKGRKVS